MFFALTVSLFLFCSPVAMAEDSEIPGNRLFMESLTGARLNPMGLQTRFGLSYRRRLFTMDGVLFQDTYASVGPIANITPGNGGIGGQVQVMPLAILRLKASYELFGSFGVFRQIHAFESLDVDYHDDALKALGSGNSRMGGIGRLEALLQMKLGPVAARNTFAAHRYDMKVSSTEVAFYDQSLDLLVPTRGWAWTNDTDLLVMMPNGFTVGARWSASKALHDNPGDSVAAKATHRVGPIMAYTFFNEPGSVFNTPTLFFISQWQAAHPYRTGQEQAAWLPTLSIGFAFTGDLLPWD
jgi:hypothetical protein